MVHGLQLNPNRLMTKDLKPVLLAFILAWVIAMPSISLAATRTIAVFPVSGDNVAPEILQAAGELLKDHLQRSGVFNVVSPAPGTSAGVEPTPAQAAQQAAALGAEQAVVLRVTHFGTSARIRLNAYAVPSAQVVYWDSIAIVGGPEELDVVIQRLVHGMVTGKPVRESAEIDTVTEKEGQTLNRRTANKSFLDGGCCIQSRRTRRTLLLRRCHRCLLPIPTRGHHPLRGGSHTLGLHAVGRAGRGRNDAAADGGPPAWPTVFCTASWGDRVLLQHVWGA